MKKWMVIATTIIAAFSGTASGVEIPKIDHRVNDYAGILNEQQKGQLESKLEAHEKESSDQIVILIVKSLEGMDRDAYSQKVFDSAKIGQKNIDNGILILQSTGDRQIRITTGRGLEGRLPDGKCGEIRDHMTPHLKSGDFFGAYNIATDEIIAAIKGENQATTQPASAGVSGWWFLLLLVPGVGIVVILWLFFREKRRLEDRTWKYTPSPSPAAPTTSYYAYTPVYGGGRSSSRSSDSSYSGSSSSDSSSSSSSSDSDWGSSSSSSGSFDGGGGCSDGGGAGGSY